MAVVDMLLIIACVSEYSVLNVFVGYHPRWYLTAFPYFIHPIKVKTVDYYIINCIRIYSKYVPRYNFMI
jgi:hypothetical protein